MADNEPVTNTCKEIKAITRGIYTAASGMLADEASQNIIAQNLANANTTGYKRDVTQFESFPQVLLRNSSVPFGPPVGSLGSGVAVSSVTTDFSPGALQQTGNPLDIAITGNAFLAVQTPQGVLYTRDGALSRSAAGNLIQAASGYPVLDTQGKTISIPAATKSITITDLGNLEADGTSVGQLNLSRPSAQNGAFKVGGNMFQLTNAQPANTGVTLQQGFLESSNVNTVQEMVAMIAVQRAYETDQKMVQSENSATQKAVTDVAKL